MFGPLVAGGGGQGGFQKRGPVSVGPQANLDEGAMWPTAFAMTELTAADEARW
jgi:hypothetical protein